MADHFALMTGRMITEATLQSAIHQAFDVPSMKAAFDHHDPSVFEDGRTKSGVMVECKICQEEGDEAYMETPCSCKGSLKYAHHICIQRWCNEKGDTICEICLQQFTPNYSPPLKLFRIGRNQISFRRAGETPENPNADENITETGDHAAGTSSFDSQGSNPKGATYCRVIAIALMALLLLRDAISLLLGGPEVYSMALITLLMLRTTRVVIPIYIIMISVVTLLHRYHQHQFCQNTRCARRNASFRTTNSRGLTEPAAAATSTTCYQHPVASGGPTWYAGWAAAYPQPSPAPIPIYCSRKKKRQQAVLAAARPSPAYPAAGPRSATASSQAAQDESWLGSVNVSLIG